VAEAKLEPARADSGLSFNIWWAIGEAVAVALLVPALRLFGAI
jgi:hypothetical protein